MQEAAGALGSAAVDAQVVEGGGACPAGREASRLRGACLASWRMGTAWLGFKCGRVLRL